MVDLNVVSICPEPLSFQNILSATEEFQIISLGEPVLCLYCLFPKIQAEAEFTILLVCYLCPYDLV